MKIIFIGLILFSTSAFADCNPVNLVTEKNSPFNKLPVLDQDGTGLCYAYAASQLLDYAAIKSGKERSYHPLWIALKHSEASSKSSTYTGYAFKAISDLSTKRNCPYSRVSRALQKWALKASVSEVNLIHLIENYGTSLKNRSRSPIADAIKINEPWCEPNTKWDTLAADLEKIKNTSALQMFTSILSETCPSSVLENSPYTATDELIVPTKVISELSKKLNENKGPVGIGMCANVLTNPTYQGVVQMNNQFGTKKDCGHHELLVVGKRMNGRSCEFLVRNSWGSSFSDATRNRLCLCRHRVTGAFVENCTNQTHNNGLFLVEGCWMSGEQLSNNVSKTINLKKL